MKNKIVLAGLLIAISGLLFLISGCASTGPLAVQEANYPADKVNARGLFVENCSVCHGQNGRAHTFHGWRNSSTSWARVPPQSRKTVVGVTYWSSALQLARSI